MKTRHDEFAPGVDRGNWRERVEKHLAARGVKVALHPQGGHTLAVPSSPSAGSFKQYEGHFATKGQALRTAERKFLSNESTH